MAQKIIKTVKAIDNLPTISVATDYDYLRQCKTGDELIYIAVDDDSQMLYFYNELFELEFELCFLFALTVLDREIIAAIKPYFIL